MPAVVRLSAQAPALWVRDGDTHTGAYELVGRLRGGWLVLARRVRNHGARELRFNATVFTALPVFAAWRLVDAVDGFEVVYAQPNLLRGHSCAVEDGTAYAVRYEIALDDRWRTREARVASDTVAGPRETLMQSNGEGRWTVDGKHAPHLDGLVDVDLEASACTNTLPIHRLSLPLGEVTAASAVYVRALDLSVTRLDQTYRRLDDRCYDYTSEGGDFRAVLKYDAAGLIVDYPGIAVRFA